KSASQFASGFGFVFEAATIDFAIWEIDAQNAGRFEWNLPESPRLKLETQKSLFAFEPEAKGSEQAIRVLAGC
ncbi:MAG: hypothetical protein WBC93_20300, partial [Sulfitobacter sp.]